MFRTTAAAVFAFALSVPAFAQKGPVIREVPVLFEMRMEVNQDADGWTYARLEGSAVHLGVLIASLDGETRAFPGLPPILANPVILGCGVMQDAYAFTVGKIPQGLVVYLQGAGLSLDNQIAATDVQKVAG